MQLTITEFVTALCVASAALMLCCALVSRYLHRRGERRALARRVICRLCLHAFENSARDRIIHCPACGAANAREGRR